MAKPFLAKHTDSITEADSGVSGNILLYASDADGDALSVARVDGGYVDDTGKKGTNTFVGTYGTLVIHTDGSYTYTLTYAGNIPDGVHLTDDFSIKIRDGNGEFSQNLLVIDILGLHNNRPLVVDDSYNVTGGAPGVTGNVLANDSDADGDPLHVSGVGAGSSTSEHISGAGTNTVIEGVYGTLTINDSGSFTYLLNTSDPDYIALAGGSAVDHFSYKVSDGQPEKPNTDFGYIDFHIN